MIMIRFLEMLALMLGSIGVIWKVFGPKIRKYVEGISSIEDQKTKIEILEEVEHVATRQKEILRRLNKHDGDDMSYRGYSILRACKEGIERGYIGALEFQQLELMYSIYTDDDGNGAVKTMWNKFVEEVEIK